MDRLAQQVATVGETAADRIRQLPATAWVAATDRARFTAAAAQPRLTRRHAPRAVVVVAIAAEAAVAVDRTPPVAVVATAGAADIDNSV